MRIALFAALACALLASACTVVDHSPGSVPLARDASWALLPIANHTDVPQAGLRAEALTEALLRSTGVAKIAHYPPALNPDALFEPAERRVQQDAHQWAREQGARYGVSGALEEWRYKVGVDGEPAVGIALQVVDLQSGEVLWSGVGAKTGWSREALSAVAQKLIRELLATARIQ